MRSFDFLSAVMACVVTFAAIRFAIRAFGYRVSVSIVPIGAPAATPSEKNDVSG